MSDLSKYRDRAAEALHRARHRGLSCLDGEDCIEADESDEAADALLAPGGVVAEIVAEAWDTGFRHARFRHDGELIGALTDNPHRADERGPA
jgi:hypothetical protein